MKKLPRVAVPVSLANRYLRSIYRGVAEYAHLQPRPFDALMVAPEALGSLRPKPDGVIALSATLAELEAIEAMKVPTVSCCDRFERAGLPAVTGDNLAMGRVAGEHLLGCGFRAFGFYGQPEGLAFIQRRQGFERAIKTAALSYSSQLREPNKSAIRPGASERRRLQKWLKELSKPVGILCSTDWDAWDVYDACEEIGVKIRDEVGLVGIDNDEFLCESRSPALSSVENRPDRIGFEAASVMVRILRGERLPSKPILISPLGVVQRPSTDVFAGHDPHIAKVIRFIRDHLDQPLEAQDVFGLVPLSRRVLERRFRRFLDHSILQEIHRLKIERIMQLLTNTDHTIEEIASRCGYANTSHMTSLFRQKTKMTPTDYRRQFRDKRAAH